MSDIMSAIALRPATRLARLAARLRACESGVALTEFAMALPVLLTLGLVGLETANLAMAHLRVSNIAMLTADNAARVRDGIDETNVIELLTGAKMSGDSIRFRQNGRIILSSIEPNVPASGPSNGQWIRWQRCDGTRNVASRYGGEGTGRTTNVLQAVGPASNQVSASAGTAVMVAEVEYRYQPVVSDAIFGSNRIIRYESAFNVRQRTDQVMKNASNLPANQRRTCNYFNP
jgi:hypothetical protein